MAQKYKYNKQNHKNNEKKSEKIYLNNVTEVNIFFSIIQTPDFTNEKYWQI